MCVVCSDACGCSYAHLRVGIRHGFVKTWACDVQFCYVPSLLWMHNLVIRLGQLLEDLHVFDEETSEVVEH